MIKPIFKNLQEIRMGSPYKDCDLELQGTWTPKLPQSGWQNIFAKDDKDRFLVLVAWDILDNNPGFKLYVVDSKKKIVLESCRYSGCCKSISWSSSGVNLEIFEYFAVPK